MPPLKKLLIEELQGLYHAESALAEALPEMAVAAQHVKSRAALEKHLAQTRRRADRLKQVFSLLGTNTEAEPCKAMTGLVGEGEETTRDFEIPVYGSARDLARQIGGYQVAKILSRTPGEEESTDFLLSSISQPLMRQALLEHSEADLNLCSAPAVGLLPVPHSRVRGAWEAGRVGLIGRT